MADKFIGAGREGSDDKTGGISLAAVRRAGLPFKMFA
jgi:hypothetical protein